MKVITDRLYKAHLDMKNPGLPQNYENMFTSYKSNESKKSEAKNP